MRGLFDVAGARCGSSAARGETTLRATRWTAFAQVGTTRRHRRRGDHRGFTAEIRRGRHEGRWRGRVVARARRRRRAPVNLHVLTQRAGVRVALVAAAHFARVWLVARVHVRVFLAVAAVGEASLAALELTPEGLLP